MFTFVFLSPSPPSTTEIFSKTPKMPCLVPHISKTIQLNKKMLKDLLTNFLGSFQIRKDPMSDIGTLKSLYCREIRKMATQNEESLERNVAVRGAHRGVLTRLIKEAEQNLLEVPNSEEGIDRLQTLSEAIEAKGKVLESLDEKVLSKIKTDGIEREVNESSSYAEKLSR